ncbi:universal stress protein [Photobacterium aquae]|uniref:Universal stress protein n=1 Tax=Photobacterium aquae TaxID=1195763 RepID=A0A0J1H6K2_9GAMM|nr:universal stress protein [Photobacterium aquae]KLV07334.1 universal stress protein [Photobacterium aquae]
MALYQTILLAVDPTDNEAHRLMVKAAVIAEQNNAELHLAFVEPGMGNVSFADAELGIEEAHNELEQRRMEQLRGLADTSPYKVRAIHMANGDVVKHLVFLADKVGANLVVTGHRRSGIHWFKDISRALADELDCDVLICQ